MHITGRADRDSLVEWSGQVLDAVQWRNDAAAAEGIDRRCGDCAPIASS